MIDRTQNEAGEGLSHTPPASTASFRTRKEGITVDFLTRPRHLHILRMGYRPARLLRPRQVDSLSEDVPPPLKSYVDVAAAIDTAKAAVESAGADTIYAELMANYVELGTLLEAWNRSELDLTDEQFEEACRRHIARSIELGKANEEQERNRWAVYFLKHSGVWLGEHA